MCFAMLLDLTVEIICNLTIKEELSGKYLHIKCAGENLTSHDFVEKWYEWKKLETISKPEQKGIIIIIIIQLI